MKNDITFWELTYAQLLSLSDYFEDMGVTLPTFTPYNDLYYLEQNGSNLAAYGELFVNFDIEDDGIVGNSIGSRSWSGSTVPSALWP